MNLTRLLALIRRKFVALIELKDVKKIYDLGEVKVEALRGATLSIEKGEYIALIGPSGSGKSTLMNTLGCLDRPSSGSFLLDGKEIVTMSRNARARIRNQKIGFVFQNFNLLNRTPAVENVELPLLYSRGVSARKRRQKAIELLELVGLGDRLDHHPGQLSGGQQQRVAIARALVNDPAILMGDEPTGNLDTKTSREVITMFRKLNEERNITIILVTHDQAVAKNADRIVVLRDGLIVKDTTDADEAIEALHNSEEETIASSESKEHPSGDQPTQAKPTEPGSNEPNPQNSEAEPAAQSVQITQPELSDASES